MQYLTITFYKFFEVESPELLREYFRGLCEGYSLKGRILIANEGINAGVSGEKEKIQEFKEKIKKNNFLSDITFREFFSEYNPYHKLVVRVRKEVITFGEEVNIHNTADYITPENLKKLYEKKEDFVILDSRNNYESEVGRFKGAVILPIEKFKDFSKSTDSLENIKDKKVVMYCTGGIRCEKSSAYLKNKGFKNVLQLKGGIIDYINKFPGQEFEGGLFVFDDRLVADTGSESKIGRCKICEIPCNFYLDCHNLDCDKLFICCQDCRTKMNNTCSEECKNSERMRPKELSFVY